MLENLTTPGIIFLGLSAIFFLLPAIISVLMINKHLYTKHYKTPWALVTEKKQILGTYRVDFWVEVFLLMRTNKTFKILFYMPFVYFFVVIGIAMVMTYLEST